MLRTGFSAAERLTSQLYYNLGLFVACMNLETNIIPMPYTIISLIPHKSSRK